MEFGYVGNINTFAADFFDDKLIVSDSTTNSSAGFTMTFTDDAFIGATLVETQDTFITRTSTAILMGTTVGILEGNKITVTWPGTGIPGLIAAPTFSATFTIKPAQTDAAAPEPTTLTLFTMVGAACAIAWRQRSRQNAP
jgi:hypothetical protein